MSDPEAIARAFHEAYERLAPSFGYKTREASAVPWEQVPEQNRLLMVAVASELSLPTPPDQERNNTIRDLILRAQKAEAERDDYRSVLTRFRDFVGDADPSIIDAFVFGENVAARAQSAAPEVPGNPGPDEPEPEAVATSVHVFGHHEVGVDPWDALLADIRVLEGDDHWASSLVVFWRGEARERGAG